MGRDMLRRIQRQIEKGRERKMGKKKRMSELKGESENKTHATPSSNQRTSGRIKLRFFHYPNHLVSKTITLFVP
jgi:hypothetical protein